MKLELLKARMLQVVTAPPEILYALSRHGVFILVLCTGGLALFLGWALAEPEYFRGQAKVQVDPSKSLLVSAGEGQRRERYDPRSFPAFINTQKDVLTSETVFTRLVDFARPQSSGGREDEKDMGAIKRKLRAAYDWFEEWVAELEYSDFADTSEDQAVRRAIVNLRRRTTVEVDQKSKTIVLQVYGSDRTEILRVLENWIKIYKLRLQEMQREKYSWFLQTRMERWREEEKKSAAKVAEFKQQHKEADPANLRRVESEISELQLNRRMISDEISRIRLGTAPVALPKESNPKVDKLRETIRDLEIKRTLMVGEGKPPDSSDVKSLVNQISALKRDLEAVVLGTDLDGTGTRPVSLEDLDTQRKEVETKLQDLYREEVRVRGFLSDLNALQEQYKTAHETYNSYLLKDLEIEDQAALVETVQVMNSEEPWVDMRPVNDSKAGRAALGGAGGLAVGILLALVFEILSGRVRFANDVEREVGLPVVTVIPKR